MEHSSLIKFFFIAIRNEVAYKQFLLYNKGRKSFVEKAFVKEKIKMILLFLIFSSIVVFVYFKVQQSRGVGPMETRWHSSKASMSIGVFFIAFGVNSYVNLQSSVAAIVALLFVTFGAINIFFGYKHYKAVSPYAKKEMAENEKQTAK